MATILEINDFTSPELALYSNLNETQLLHYYEPGPGVFIAESPKVILRALQAGYQPVSILTEQKPFTEETKELLAHCGDIPVYTAPFELLTKLTGFQLTRGMLCAMRRLPLPAVEDICKNANRIVVLENVMNPTNVGAIFRSAAALGMDAILLTSGCSDPFYRRASRVSMGTVLQIPWTYLPTPKKASGTSETFPVSKNTSYISSLKKLGFTTAAMALKEDSTTINHPQLTSSEKLAIVLGTEGDGLAKNTIAECDYTVMIPMAHGVDSLNVAAASAVAFWELGKR